MSKIIFLCAALLFAASCSHGGSKDDLYCAVIVAGTEECIGYADLTAEQISAEKTACAALSGNVVDRCAPDTVGCCKMSEAGYSVEECYYAGEAVQLAAACTGSWSAGSSGGPALDGSADGGSDGDGLD